MLFPVMVDTKLRERSMSSRFFVRDQSTRIICTRHTPSTNVSIIIGMYVSSPRGQRSLSTHQVKSSQAVSECHMLQWAGLVLYTERAFCIYHDPCPIAHSMAFID